MAIFPSLCDAVQPERQFQMADLEAQLLLAR